MVDVVFGMPAVLRPTVAPPASPSLTPEADKALGMLLKDEELLKTLANASFPTLPPSDTTVVDVLWAMLNSRGNSAITQADVDRVIRDHGGNATDVTALWNVLDPKRTGRVTGDKFITNDYLSVMIPTLQSTWRPAVDEARQKMKLEEAAGSSGTVLDSFANGTEGGGFINVFA